MKTLQLEKSSLSRTIQSWHTCQRHRGRPEQHQKRCSIDPEGSEQRCSQRPGPIPRIPLAFTAALYMSMGSVPESHTQSRTGRDAGLGTRTHQGADGAGFLHSECLHHLEHIDHALRLAAVNRRGNGTEHARAAHSIAVARRER